MEYDYLIVGAGLYGATFANLAKEKGKKVLVIDRRNHIAGNIYTEEVVGINVHKYGAHIFHTDYKEVWEYVNKFVEFNRYTNSPIARIGNEVYNLPFNMNTFSKMWNIATPKEAAIKIDEEKKEIKGIPQNLEEQAISLVGRTIYEKLIKGYTEKQWNRKCTELPAFIIKRLPVRMTYDNNYFNDRYQGIPIGGYTKLVEKMLEGIEVKLEEDFILKREYYKKIAKKIVYTGAIDEYFDFKEGELEYRSLKFDTRILECNNFQGNAVVNYTGDTEKYTRVIEHKHFEFGNQEKTVVTYEYPDDYEKGKEYKKLAEKEENVIFGARLAEYKYYDMDDVIKASMDRARKELEGML